MIKGNPKNEIFVGQKLWNVDNSIVFVDKIFDEYFITMINTRKTKQKYEVIGKSLFFNPHNSKVRNEQEKRESKTIQNQTHSNRTAIPQSKRPNVNKNQLPISGQKKAEPVQSKEIYTERTLWSIDQIAVVVTKVFNHSFNTIEQKSNSKYIRKYLYDEIGNMIFFTLNEAKGYAKNAREKSIAKQRNIIKYIIPKNYKTFSSETNSDPVRYALVKRKYYTRSIDNALNTLGLPKYGDASKNRYPKRKK